jgi:hypothetical protein
MTLPSIGLTFTATHFIIYYEKVNILPCQLHPIQRWLSEDSKGLTRRYFTASVTFSLFCSHCIVHKFYCRRDMNKCMNGSMFICCNKIL